MIVLWLPGYLYREARRTATAVIHMEEAFSVFSELCSSTKVRNIHHCESSNCKSVVCSFNGSV